MSELGNNGPMDDDEIDLAALFGVVYARKFTIIFVTLVAVVFGVAFALITPPQFRADALMQLEEKSGGGLAVSAELSALFGAPPQTVAEIEILKSRMILVKVIENLDLTLLTTPRRLPVIGDFLRRYDLPSPKWEFLAPYLAPYAWNNEQIALGRLEMPVESGPLTLTSLGEGRYSVDLGNGRIVEGKVGETLRDTESGLAILVDRLTGKSGREYLVDRMPLSTTLDNLLGDLSISEKGKGSMVLQLTLKAADPAWAVRVLNEITDVYLLQNLSRNAAEADASLTFIREQLPDAEARMSTAEQAINTFKQAQSSVDLSFETRALLEEAVQLEAQLNVLQLEEQELQKRYTPQHPIYQTLLEKRAQLEARLTSIRTQTANLPETQQEMLRLSQDLEVSREIYLQLVNRAQELSVIKAGTIANVRIIDQAFAGAYPVAPNKKLIVALAGMLGLFAGIGYILLRSFMARGIESPEQLETLGLSVYATVPKVGAGTYGGNVGKKGPRPILAKENKTDLAVEALRSLRTSLHFGMIEATSKILMVTSASPGEGKTFLAVNLATVVAQAGQNVCLVDGDLRRGYMRRFFGKDKSVRGLSEVLSGEAMIEEVLQQDETTGLYYLPTGKYPPNPSELLMSRKFGETMAYLSKRFDLTIVDTPPILAVTDAAIVGKYAGMILLAVRYQETTTDQVKAAVKAFNVVAEKITGCVLNGYDAKKSRYGYGNYSYQYAYKTRK